MSASCNNHGPAPILNASPYPKQSHPDADAVVATPTPGEATPTNADATPTPDASGRGQGPTPTFAPGMLLAGRYRIVCFIAAGAEARAAGLKAYELEAWLALAEVEMRAGRAEAARARLREVASEARSKGLELLVRQAATLRS